MIGWGHMRPKPIKTASLREYDGVILYHPNNYYCKYCKKARLEKNPFTFERFNSSYQLLRSIFKYLGNLNYTLDMISKELHVSSTQINKYIDSYIVIPERDLPEWLGIDEIHNPELSYKHSSYLCVLVDGQKRQPYDVLGSRSKSYLNNYFMAIPLNKRLKVKYVTIDLWKTYKDVAKKCFPNCIVAVDPFHYCKHLCDGFEDLRINLMNNCEYGSNAYYLLKKFNWLLTIDDIHLDNEPKYNSRFKTKLNYRDILKMILTTFPILEEAYFLKEQFRFMVKSYDYETMVQTYDTVISMFKDSNIKQYDEFISILENWKQEILNSFLRPYDEHKLSNALTENINGKLGVYISISHGINNLSRFRKRVLYSTNTDVFYSLSNSLKSDSLPGKKRGSYHKAKN